MRLFLAFIIALSTILLSGFVGYVYGMSIGIVFGGALGFVGGQVVGYILFND